MTETIKGNIWRISIFSFLFFSFQLSWHSHRVKSKTYYFNISVNDFLCLALKEEKGSCNLMYSHYANLKVCKMRSGRLTNMIRSTSSNTSGLRRIREKLLVQPSWNGEGQIACCSINQSVVSQKSGFLSFLWLHETSRFTFYSDFRFMTEDNEC